MKILYIITQADGGGAQNYTLALAKHFGGAIAAGSEDSKLFDVAHQAGLQTFPLKYLKRAIHPYDDLMAMWEIRQLIKFYRPEIVHLNSSKAGVVGSFASGYILNKPKVIFTAHGFIFNEPLSPAKRTFYLALEKIASDFRDYIICVSEADHKSALDNNLIKPNKISTIHNGLAPINFFPRNEAKVKLNLPNDKLIIGCVASFYTTKGIDVLIEAVGLLNEEIKQKIQVAIIGDGPEYENCKIQIENLSLQKNISLLGKMDAAKNLKAFDLFVLPSRKEGFPFALLEAMQAGLPIVATEVGGMGEALDDAGILIPPQNPQALAKAITSLLSSDTKMKELSAKALARAKLFTEEKMLLETKKIYDLVVSRKY